MPKLNLKRLATVGPAVLVTAVSLVLTLAVIVMWLGDSMPWGVALVVGVGLDGGWLATLAYERRLAAQGDHNNVVTGIGWGFGAVATGVLVAHALGEDSPGPWLAVAWLPLAAKALWLVHGLWERTALTPAALDRIATIQQGARDQAAIARAELRAEAGTEATRLDAVTGAGKRVAEAQAKAARRLAGAWSELDGVRQGDGTGRALTCVTERVTPASQDGAQPRWQLPIWGSFEELAAIEAPALTDDAIDAIVAELRASTHPPMSYRDMAAAFRAAGHSAGETRLRASWKRVTTAEAVGS
ncbi:MULTISPECIES: protein spdB [unclassified Streptomyces]|uniref:protein spdB n=1 Tax=unclassified Streptomyces TaxID=2593676 RepID=UPI0037112D78